MTVIEAQPVDLTEHVFRSIRGWLHGLFPDIEVFIMRDESMRGEDANTEAVRPAFRLELVTGPGWDEAAPGWSWLLMNVIIHYAAVAGEQAVWDLQRVVGKIRANATRPKGRIPMNLYNFVWPQPPEITVANIAGGTLPRALDIAVAAVAPEGGTKASAPSELVVLDVPAAAIVGVRPRNWPSGSPLAASWEIYAAEHGEALTLQGTCSEGSTFELAALALGATPPTNRRLSWSGIRVDSMDVANVEAEGQERTFSAAVTIRLRALSPITTAAQIDATLV